MRCIKTTLVFVVNTEMANRHYLTKRNGHKPENAEWSRVLYKHAPAFRCVTFPH
jgi:hypothetical protein